MSCFQDMIFTLNYLPENMKKMQKRLNFCICTDDYNKDYDIPDILKKSLIDFQKRGIESS